MLRSMGQIICFLSVKDHNKNNKKIKKKTNENLKKLNEKRNSIIVIMKEFYF